MVDDAVYRAEGNAGGESLYRPVLCRLESISDLTPIEKHFRLTKLDGEPFGHQPGQFVQVSVFGVGEP